MAPIPLYNQPIPDGDLRAIIDRQAGDTGRSARNDPGFQLPSDPLLQGDAKRRTATVVRDLPLVTIQNNWTVAGVRGALCTHTAGIFDQSAQLADSILGDDRVQATLNSRMSGLFGREVRHRPANDSSAAREVLDAWVDCAWPVLAGDSALIECHTYQILMGWTPAQLLWQDGEYMLPHLRFFHPRYSYYHWTLRKYIALTLDGQKVIYPGDGQWVLHAPKGIYRGWMWGAIRAIAEPWLLRHFAFRDMARYSERSGMPIIKAKVPAVADQKQRDAFMAAISSIGTETAVMLNQGVDGINNYDVDLLEVMGTNWEIFPGLVDRCDMSIVLALLFQNLTTEVKGGSFAATEAHMDIRQNGIESDNTGWRTTLRQQVARPFAYLNFGDADLAPVTDWDVEPVEDKKEKAARFYSFGQSVQILRQAGVQFDDEDALRKMARDIGVKLPKGIRLTEPDNGAGSGSASSVTDEAATKAVKGGRDAPKVPTKDPKG